LKQKSFELRAKSNEDEDKIISCIPSSLVTIKGHLKIPNYEQSLIAILTALGLEGSNTSERIKEKSCRNFIEKQRQYVLPHHYDMFSTDLESLLLHSKDKVTGVNTTIFNNNNTTTKTIEKMKLNIFEEMIMKFENNSQLDEYVLSTDNYTDIPTSNLHGRLPYGTILGPKSDAIPLSMNLNSIMGRVAIARDNMKYDSHICLLIYSFIRDINTSYSRTTITKKIILSGKKITIIGVPTVEEDIIIDMKGEELKYYKNHFFNNKNITITFPCIIIDNNVFNSSSLTPDIFVFYKDFKSPYGAINSINYPLSKNTKKCHIQTSHPHTVLSLILKSLISGEIDPLQSFTITVVGLFHISLRSILAKIMITNLSPSHHQFSINFNAYTVVMLSFITANNYAPLIIELSERDIISAWTQHQNFMNHVDEEEYLKSVSIITNDMKGNLNGVMLFTMFLYLKLNFTIIDNGNNTLSHYLFISYDEKILRKPLDVFKMIQSSPKYLQLGLRSNDSKSLPSIETIPLMSSYICHAFDSFVSTNNVNVETKGCATFIDKKNNERLVVPVCYGFLVPINETGNLRSSSICVYCDCQVCYALFYDYFL
jgi:hypothetical protein